MHDSVLLILVCSSCGWARSACECWCWCARACGHQKTPWLQTSFCHVITAQHARHAGWKCPNWFQMCLHLTCNKQCSTTLQTTTGWRWVRWGHNLLAKWLSDKMWWCQLLYRLLICNNSLSDYLEILQCQSYPSQQKQYGDTFILWSCLSHFQVILLSAWLAGIQIRCLVSPSVSQFLLVCVAWLIQELNYQYGFLYFCSNYKTYNYRTFVKQSVWALSFL
jgi:hypothetical protein